MGGGHGGAVYEKSSPEATPGDGLSSGRAGIERRSGAVVQGDRSVLVEVEHPAYEEARALLVRCAELEKSPEHIHTYRLSDLSLWNAASTGLTADAVVAGLRSISRFKPASHLEH